MNNQYMPKYVKVKKVTKTDGKPCFLEKDHVNAIEDAILYEDAAICDVIEPAGTDLLTVIRHVADGTSSTECKISSISKNGTILPIDDQKNVDITVPTQLSQLNEDDYHTTLTVNQKASISNKRDFTDMRAGSPTWTFDWKKSGSLVNVEYVLEPVPWAPESGKYCYEVVVKNSTDDRVGYIGKSESSTYGESVTGWDSQLEAETATQGYANNELGGGTKSVVYKNTYHDSLAKISDIQTIEKLIPDQASETNKLADKNFVNSSIQTNTAYFDGNWLTYSAIPTDVSGFVAKDLPVPGPNNYLVVIADETHSNETWRYKYTGSGETYSKNSWIAEYKINNTSFTSAQIAALNSGITVDGVEAISNKVDKIEGKGLSANDFTNEDKLKLTNIEEQAQVNKIESINLNNSSTDLPISDRKVSIVEQDPVFNSWKVGQSIALAGEATAENYGVAIGYNSQSNLGLAIGADAQASNSAAAFGRYARANGKGSVQLNGDEHGVVSNTEEYTLKFYAGSGKGNVTIINNNGKIPTSSLEFNPDNKVDTSRTIAGISLNANISDSSLRTAINVENGSQKNKIEHITINGTDLNVNSTGKVASGNIKPYQEFPELWNGNNYKYSYDISGSTYNPKLVIVTNDLRNTVYNSIVSNLSLTGDNGALDVTNTIQDFTVNDKAISFTYQFPGYDRQTFSKTFDEFTKSSDPVGTSSLDFILRIAASQLRGEVVPGYYYTGFLGESETIGDLPSFVTKGNVIVYVQTSNTYLISMTSTDSAPYRWEAKAGNDYFGGWRQIFESEEPTESGSYVAKLVVGNERYEATCDFKCQTRKQYYVEESGSIIPCTYEHFTTEGQFLPDVTYYERKFDSCEVGWGVADSPITEATDVQIAAGTETQAYISPNKNKLATITGLLKNADDQSLSSANQAKLQNWLGTNELIFTFSDNSTKTFKFVCSEVVS